jgi:hypothetical protein
MATEFINTKTKAGIWEHGLTTNNTGLVSTNQAMANATSDVGETANLLMLLILML